MCNIHSTFPFQYDPGRGYSETDGTTVNPSDQPGPHIVVQPTVTVTVPHPVPAPPALEEVLLNG